MAAAKPARDVQPSNPFIKQLASSNRTTRDRALSALRSYLSSPRPNPLSTLDLLKLWKGFFYCMFMSDKPRNQQALARDLAALVDVLPERKAKLDFMGAFWTIMGKEWGNIDYLRMDKYLYLVRCYVRKGFEVLEGSGWAEEVVEEYNVVLQAEGGPLSARDHKVANGIRLHVLDVWVDELEKVDGEKRDAPVEKLMEPVRRMKSEAFAKSVQKRAKESLEDDRLVDGLSWRDEEDDDHREGSDEANFDAQKDQHQASQVEPTISDTRRPSDLSGSAQRRPYKIR